LQHAAGSPTEAQVARGARGRREPARLALLLALIAPAWVPAASRPAQATSSLGVSVMQAPMPKSGAGSAHEPTPPATEAEARRAFAETASKCRQLQTAAVRDECLRQAQRDLDRELQRLRRGPAGSGASE